MHHTTNQLIRWKYPMPSCLTRPRGKLRVRGSDRGVVRTPATLLQDQLPFWEPRKISKGCNKLFFYQQLQPKPAMIHGGSFIRCYCDGIKYPQPLLVAHAIGAYYEEEQREPAASNGSQGLQPTEEGNKSSILLPVPSLTQLEAVKEVDESPMENDRGSDDPQCLEDGNRLLSACNTGEQAINKSSIHTSQSSADLTLVTSICFILEQNGWGPNTEKMLQWFVGKITPEIAANVVSQQRNAKVAAGFLEWVGKDDNYENQAESFTKVIGRLGKERDFATAWNVMDSMKRHGLEVNYAFSVFLHRLKSVHRVDEVVRAMDCMGNLNVIPTVPLYTCALQLILKANNLGEAQRLYQQMLKTGLQPDNKLYGVLISGFGKAGKLDDAICLFREMKSRGFSPDSFIYTSLIRSYSAAGKFEGAQEAYKEMIDNNCLPKVFTHFELACALHGENIMAHIGTFLEDLEMRGHNFSVYTYNNMLQYLLATGNWWEVVGIFHKLSEKVQGNSQKVADGGVYPSLDSYAIVIIGLCEQGKLVEALKFFEEMLASGPKPSAAICNNLLLSLSNAGMIDESLQFCDYILKQKLILDVGAQKAFFRAIRASGHLSKGFRVFEALKWRGCIDQSSNFRTLSGMDN